MASKFCSPLVLLLALVAALSLPSAPGASPSTLPSKTRPPVPQGLAAPHYTVRKVAHGPRDSKPTAQPTHSSKALRKTKDQDHGSVLAESSPEVGVAPDPAMPQLKQTRMRCVTTATDDLACMFHNIYFDLASGRFQFFGSNPATEDWRLPQNVATEEVNEVTLERKTVVKVAPVQAEPRSSSGFGTSRYKPLLFKDANLTMEWNPVPPVDTSSVIPVPQRLLMRQALNGNSFGHLLRDDYRPFLQLPAYFGEPPGFQWVPEPHPQIEDDRIRGDSHEHQNLMSRYHSWAHDTLPISWPQLLDNVAPRRSDGGPPQGLIRFDRLLISSHARKLEFVDENSHLCTAAQWSVMADSALRRAGIAPVAAGALPVARVVVMGFTQTERGISNLSELVEELRQRLPFGVRVEEVFFQQYTGDEQLEILAKTSVLITNVGSRSFRMLYLPEGAHVVMIGAPSGFMQPDENQPPVELWDPFREVGHCWDHFSHVSVQRIHISNETSAVTFGEPRPWPPERVADPEGQKQLQRMRLWDAKVAVDVDQVAGVVEAALRVQGKLL